MAETIPFIYDKIFKRILTLSSKSVINLINGLFGTDYPEDSTITYNWTEFADDELRRTLADSIITINDRYSYHIEAQMENDADIVFRVFAYSFQHANRHRISEDGNYYLKFPEPKIIYLYSDSEIPEKYTLHLQFGAQTHFNYVISTINLCNTSIQEINEKKLIILIPFQLLKLRKLLSKSRTPENIRKLHNLIQYDILNSIDINKKAGNINAADARVLMQLTNKLLKHLYAKYPETEEVCDMFDHSLNLEIDQINARFEKAEAQLEKAEEKLAEAEGKLSVTEDKLSVTENKLSVTEDKLSVTEDKLSVAEERILQQNAEIARLKAELAKRN